MHVRRLLFAVFTLAWATSVHAQTPSHNWTIQVGDSHYGIIGFDGFSFVQYGFGMIEVPLSAESVLLCLILSFVLTFACCLILVSKWNRRAKAQGEVE